MILDPRSEEKEERENEREEDQGLEEVEHARVWSIGMRLDQVLERPQAVGNVTNNEQPARPGSPGQEWPFDYGFDAAQNLLGRQRHDGAQTAASLPTDTSGRNRPASVNGKALVWDANGNLIQKGDQHYQYDFRNRLTRVLDGALEIASYTFDAFNRRIEKATPSAPPVEFAWSGLQSVEEYSEGRLLQRRTYGLGVDEITHMQIDLNGNPADGLEIEYYPIYDSSGNLVTLTSPTGQRVGETFYSPFGEKWMTRVDVTPARVVSVTLENGSLVIELSEEINEDRL
ncbi:MAG: hypothetical protein KDD47_21545, partial [Acidobacteria bacterium]|nr:hypothetical protein [Acidobacteriota bacterium]